MLPTDEQTPRPTSNIQARRKGPPASLRIETPAQRPAIGLFQGDNSASTSDLSSATSESDAPLPFSQSSKPRPMRNTKRLSLNLPSAHSNNSTNSLTRVPEADAGINTDETQPGPPNVRRRVSTLSLGTGSVASRLHRKDEDDSPSAPYVDGPIEIMPGVWLGSEDNARDRKGLVERGIRSILNVAKEVNTPDESTVPSQSLRSFVSAPELQDKHDDLDAMSNRLYTQSSPSMHYKKLPWSHGQADLVQDGFAAAMAFVDAAQARGDGVLIHCQCGISRSATVVIALVMRAAALSLPTATTEVRELKDKGMHGAYAYVKERSKWAGPNMSLIYQLLEYEKVLSGGDKSPSASEHSSAVAEDEEEWSRRRRLLDEDAEHAEEEHESEEVMREAYALDKAMEERMVARKTSGSSIGSFTGLGMGSAWKSRYSSRARAGSIASSSIISEDLVEECEEASLLGVGRIFDAPSISTRSPSGETTEEEANSSPDWKRESVLPTLLPVSTPKTARPFFLGKNRSLTDPGLSANAPPPSAPATKTSFGLPRLPFKLRSKARPPPLNLLPPVPPSPVVPVSEEPEEPVKIVEPPRRRPPPLRLNSEPPVNVKSRSMSRSSLLSQLSVNTPSETLFVFPPSPTLKANTPLTMTLTSSLNVPQPYLPTPTPRVSSFKTDGRRRSFIGLTAPATPTTACSRVDARGWVGLGFKGTR